MRPKLGLTYFNCLNEGLGFPKLGASIIIPGNVIFSAFLKITPVFKYLNTHLLIYILSSHT